MSDTTHPTRGTSLKDHLFNEGKVAWLAERLAGVAPGFDARRFTAACTARFPELELKARADWMAEVLAQHLPGDFAAAARIITDSLPPPLDPALTDNDFGDFIFLPLGLFVAGAAGSHRALALATLRELTMRFSMEYPIRSFIAADPDGILPVLTAWAEDDNYHVRRLVSEGTRPLLPWAARLGLPHDWALPLLGKLHADRTRFVTRSVANHLNDVSKSDPESVLSILADWRQRGTQSAAELGWMTRHALRTLVKKGHQEALGFLGFSAAPLVRARLTLPDQVLIGDVLEIIAEIESDGDADLVIDYALHLIKANGATSRKVFKLKTASLAAGDRLTLRKAHRLHAEATTYRLNPGPTRVDLVVNGAVVASDQFELMPRI